jgi:chemosensory pili system protein ChpA (sensor histidine kinase/response regulator)
VPQFADDGAGLNLARIRERGLQLGLISPMPSRTMRLAPDLRAGLLHGQPGHRAGRPRRGHGRGASEVGAGRQHRDHLDRGQGTSFLLRLPLTTA